MCTEPCSCQLPPCSCDDGQKLRRRGIAWIGDAVPTQKLGTLMWALGLRWLLAEQQDMIKEAARQR